MTTLYAISKYKGVARMVLRSFAFMPKEIDIAFYYEINCEIQKLKWYFYKFSGVNADEAMQRTLYHTLLHFNADKGNLSAYIKKLAREITKENSRLVLVDFLEQTLSDNDESEDNMKSSIDAGNMADFSASLIEEMELSESKKPEIINLALEFMDKFLLLCEALIRHDTSTKYYPEIFIKNCLDINSRCPNFNNLCLDVYMEYKDDFEWFLSLDKKNEGWREPDFVMIANSKSRRIRLVNPTTGVDVENADLDSYSLLGRLGSGANRKKIIKVCYSDLWEYMCDLVDDCETNELKFVLGDSYICRTFGGSVSVLNPDLFNMYDVVRMEILTNVIQDTYGRVLNVGSECFYLVCNASMNKTKLIRDVHGHHIELTYEDITDKLV